MKLYYILLIQLFIFRYSKRIRWVFEISREGVRMPIQSIKNILQNYEFFRDELSGIGERQQFLLGLKKHHRYIETYHLINSSYDPHDIFFGSCGTNSSFESASAQLQGLYPSGTNLNLSKLTIANSIPPNKENFNDIEKSLGLNSLPHNIGVFPVHKLFNDEFQFNLILPKYCPGIEDYLNERKERLQIKTLINEFQKKFGKIFKKILQKSDDFSYNDIYLICNSLILEYSNGINMSKYGNKSEIKNLIQFSFHFLSIDLIGSDEEKDDEIGLITMSNTMKRIIDWIDKKVQNDINGKEDYNNYDLPKLIMYSSTEKHIGVFESFMHAAFQTSFKYPYYSSTLYIELFREENSKSIDENNYFINYFFDDELVLSIPYIKFKNKIISLIKSDDEIRKFCQFKNENFFIYINFQKMLLPIVFTIILFSLNLNIYFKFNKKQKLFI